MTYRLLIEERAVEELKSLPPKIRERIKKKIVSVLKENPFPGDKGDIKKIQGSKFWRLRVGDYRVFYDVVREENTVYILSVRHRSKAYREL